MEDHISSQPRFIVSDIIHNAPSPLQVATLEGMIGSTKLLLASGANVSASHWTNVTPLHCAAAGGSPSCIKHLLLNTGEYDEYTQAAQHRYTNAERQTSSTSDRRSYVVVMKLLIANGADVNAVGGNSGDTPLHLAARWGHCGAIGLLVSAGANKNAVNTNGKTPLAYYQGFDDHVRRLLLCPNDDVSSATELV